MAGPDQPDASLSDLAAHVHQLNRRFAAACAAGEALGRVRISQPIEPSLGVVVVDAWGTLLEVNLSRDGLRVVDPGTVGQRIRQAVHAAEQRAAVAVAEHVDRWR